MKVSLVFRLLAVVCIFMQMAAILPHHHHEDRSAPCINFLHCISDCGERPVDSHSSCGCACGHEDEAGETHRHDADDHDCSFSHIDLISVRERHELENALSAPAVPMLAVYHMCTGQCFECDRCEIALSSLDSLRQRDDGPLHTRYITAAIPPRAPSFTA